MRSLLFIPADQPTKIEKALSSQADALILDLEDSVAAGRKAEARKIIVDALPRLRERSSARLIVRINPLSVPDCDADLDHVIPARPDAVLLPKARGGADIMHLGAKLAAREALANISDCAVKIIAIATETGASLFQMGTYEGASQRLDGLAWGAEDLSADLGAETNRTPEGAWTEPYRLARTLTLYAATAATVAAIDTVYTAFRDLDGLREEAEAARRDGFTAKLAIHPAQVPIINTVFTPSSEAVRRAKAIVAAFKANPAAGVVAIDGEMIDKPHLVRAQRVLMRACRD